MKTENKKIVLQTIGFMCSFGSISTMSLLVIGCIINGGFIMIGDIIPILIIETIMGVIALIYIHQDIIRRLHKIIFIDGE